MPSIDDFLQAKKKRFKNISSQSHAEKLVEEDPKVETIIPKAQEIDIKEQPHEFQKISYRPWDDDTIPVEEKPQISKKRKSTTEPAMSPEMVIQSLYGVQRAILSYLLDNEEKEKDGFVYTRPVNMQDISLYANCRAPTASTSIKRLKAKNIIESIHHKAGRGAFVCFRIPVEFKRELKDGKEQYLPQENITNIR